MIRQINLDFRTDRWDECLKNHIEMGFSMTDVVRQSACHDKDMGALGCAKSHIKVLSDFFTSASAEYIAVLEDDFDFTETKRMLQEKLRVIHENGLAWDVLMLAGASVVNYDCDVPFLKRVFEANTTSGYIVKRSYVPTLLPCFLEAAKQLERFKNFNPIDIIKERFAIDMMWKPLQRNDNWYMFSPRLGVQRQSFSDIEKRVVDYKGNFAE